MKPLKSINLLDFSLALSETLDLASPLLAQHQLRTAYIAQRIGGELQLSPSTLEEVVFAALLHDIGAMTPEEKIDLHEDNYDKDIHIHCKNGERILGQARIFEDAAKIVRYHHTEWQEWELENATEIAYLSQVVYLADTVERAINRSEYILNQSEDLVEQVRTQTGTSFHPEIVEAFEKIASREEFWLDCTSPSLMRILRETAPGDEGQICQAAFLEVSEVVRKVIDFRSNFTATHSTGVSCASALIAEQIGYSVEALEMMRFAGNLHDVGKLALPNSILEKPAKLTKGEYALIKQHTYQTCSFLKRCGLPAYLVEWAGYHHERLDGTGYPYHMKGGEINDGSRIVAVADVLTALAEDRPYRAGKNRKGVLSIMRDMSKAEYLDCDVVRVVETCYDDIVGPTLRQQKASAALFLGEMEMIA